jgi:hypothetical protein
MQGFGMAGKGVVLLNGRLTELNGVQVLECFAWLCSRVIKYFTDWFQEELVSGGFFLRRETELDRIGRVPKVEFWS